MPRAEPRGRDGYTRASHNVGIIGPALGPHAQQTCLSMVFVYTELRCGISVSNHFAALESSVWQELVGCPQHCCVLPNVSLAAARPLRGSLQSPGLRWRAQGKHQPSRRASGDRHGVLPRCRLRMGVHPGLQRQLPDRHRNVAKATLPRAPLHLGNVVSSELNAAETTPAAGARSRLYARRPRRHRS